MNVLAAVDLSDWTSEILATARKLVGPADKLWIIHVAEPEPDFVGFDVGPQIERDLRSERFHDEHKQVQDLAAELRADGIEATGLLIQGPTVETLLREAQKLHTDMLVLGSHGRGAIARLLIGSVAEGVLRKSDCPVVIVPMRGARNS